MTKVTVGQWGNTLAVRLPSEIAEEAGLLQGERVDVEASDGNVVIRRAAPRFTLAELFRGKSAAEWRKVYAGAFDWGPELGRELIKTIR